MAEKKENEIYIEAVGRRKTSVARVRIIKAKQKSFTINNRTLTDYFPTTALRVMVESSIVNASLSKHFFISAKLKGGGISSQAEALRHGIARALLIVDPTHRAKLKAAGFLKRDPRKKERKKYGQPGARKRFQYSKR